jgi:hypothetical protein
MNNGMAKLRSTQNSTMFSDCLQHWCGEQKKEKKNMKRPKVDSKHNVGENNSVGALILLLPLTLAFLSL